MGMDERPVTACDNVVIEMVTYDVPDLPADVPLPDTPDVSPVARAAEATIEQTGADPPPILDRIQTFLDVHRRLRSEGA